MTKTKRLQIKKTRGKKMKRIISRVLIIIGLLIIAVPAYLNYNTTKTNNDIVEKYEKAITTDTIDTVEIPENIIGILEIPKTDIKVAIQEGTDEETLKYAVGHFKETVLPGEEGNFAVAGHRAYTYNKFFSNLDKVEIGDEIKVITKENTYTYRVNSSEVVLPEQVEVLNSTDNNKTITLITCTPKYSGTHRLVLKGELK